MEPAAGDILDLGLMDGENLETVLDLRGGISESPGPGEDVLILTNARLALVRQGGRGRKSSFASVHDVESVDVAEVRRGHSGYLWAGLALVISILLWFAVDNVVGAAASAVAVGAMGAFLLYDKLSEPNATRITFSARGSNLVCEVRNEEAVRDVQIFVKRLFELKDGHHPNRRWTLR